MTYTYIIIPSNLVDTIRGEYGPQHALQPVALHERTDYALPVAVLDEPAFASAYEVLGALAQEELSVEDFAWWHEQDMDA